MIWYRGVGGFAVSDVADEGRVVEQRQTYRDHLYVIVVNKSNTDTQARLTIPPAFKDAKLHVLFEDRTVQVENGTFDDLLKPYDGLP